MEQIISWIVSSIIDYREFVRNVARDTMASYDFRTGKPNENKDLFEKLMQDSKFLHLFGANGVNFHLYNVLNPN